MEQTNASDHLVFISYASPDRERVLPFYEDVSKRHNALIDCRDILPGQNWDFEIKRALNKATIILIFISNASVDRRGYVQREIKLALDKKAEKLIDDIYIIPVILDQEASIPDQLKGIHCIWASDTSCRGQILNAVKHQIERLGFQLRQTQDEEHVSWTTRILKESWNGIPGYEVEIELVDFRSDIYSNVGEISDYIKGNLISVLFEARSDCLTPMPEFFNFAQDRYRRTNTFDAHCNQVLLINKIVSVQYAVHSYGAGAAHPNYGFQTFSFMLDPTFLIRTLEAVFEKPLVALEVIRSEARKQLREALGYNDADAHKSDHADDWIKDGTNKWEDFQAFVFSKDKIDLLFAPYEVASYAQGAQFAELPYTMLAPLMKREYLSALQIEHLAR